MTLGSFNLFQHITYEKKKKKKHYTSPQVIGISGISSVNTCILLPIFIRISCVRFYLVFIHANGSRIDEENKRVHYRFFTERVSRSPKNETRKQKSNPTLKSITFPLISLVLCKMVIHNQTTYIAMLGTLLL